MVQQAGVQHSRGGNTIGVLSRRLGAQRCLIKFPDIALISLSDGHPASYFVTIIVFIYTEENKVLRSYEGSSSFRQLLRIIFLLSKI